MKENLETYALAGVGLARGAYEVGYKQQEPAHKAWLAIGAFVVGYELLAKEGQLLSEGWDKIIDKHPIIGRALPLYVTAHVVNVLPESVDLIHKASNTLDRIRASRTGA